MDRNRAEALCKSINSQLTDWAQANGVSIKIPSSCYSDNSVTVKLEVVEHDANGVAQSREQISLQEYAAEGRTVGYTMNAPHLPSDPCSFRFTEKGETYQLCGRSSRARKYPWLAKRLHDGAVYKFSSCVLARHINAASA